MIRVLGSVIKAYLLLYISISSAEIVLKKKEKEKKKVVLQSVVSSLSAEW